MTRTKKTILFIHRWLGFLSGLVVFVVSITGCIFCFQDEIQDTLYDYRHVSVQQRQYVQPSVLKQKAIGMYPGSTAAYIYYYGKDRPAAVLVSTKKDGLLAVYFNPYTAVHTHSENYAENFFVVVEYIHLYLLLPAKVGGMIVGIAVIVFVVMMITGIILWWPKRKTDRKRCLSIKWNGRWRRVNYDLHNVLGFYATAIALILALSGLSIAFEWVRSGIYTAGNLGKSYAVETMNPKSDSTQKTNTVGSPVTDLAFTYALLTSPTANMYLISDDGSASGTIGVTAYKNSLHYANSDEYAFDRYNGKLLRYLPNTKKSTGLKLNDMNYDIHVGQILGLPGKILAFFASLICASLPVTGLIIYLGKKKKSKPKIAPALA